MPDEQTLIQRLVLDTRALQLIEGTRWFCLFETNDILQSESYVLSEGDHY